MDRHVRWLRRHLLAAVTRRLLVEGVATFALTAVVLAGAGASLATTGPWAALLAQSWVVGRVLAALHTSPLNHAFLDHYLTRPFEFQPEPFDLPDEVAEAYVDLPASGLHPVVTLSAIDGDSEPRLHVYQSTNRLVTAMASATCLLSSRLSDGRILVTSPLLVPPHELLVVQFLPGADHSALVKRHSRALQGLASSDVRPVRAGPELAIDTLVIEREAFLGLGPVLGSFVSLDGSAKRHRLDIPVEPHQLLDLAAPGRIRSADVSGRNVRVEPDQDDPDVGLLSHQVLP